ncbi:MAG: hypothetical protein Q4B81_00085 [Moraxella sp.]|nr:hypothetical protein [Moraxella sp.]
MKLENYLTSLNQALDSTQEEAVELFERGEWLLSINDFLPYVGILMVLFVIFFKRFRTSGAMVSSILHLYLIIFMVQIWADGASLLYEPSRQSVIGRLLVLGVLLLTILFSCCVRKKCTKTKHRLMATQSDNRRLKVINEHLKRRLSGKV